MASFSGGGQAPLNAIVADIGQYATKIGWAGDDQPKSYFRSNVAVLREDDSNASTGDQDKTLKQTASRSPIVDVRYDYYNRPIQGYGNNNTDHDLDGKWQVANPVDPVTGLWYNDPSDNVGSGAPAGTSTGGSNNTSMQESSVPFEDTGADWADLLPKLLKHGYETGLNIRNHNDDKAQQFPLLLSERSYNPPSLRQPLLEVLMEDVQVPCVFLARDAVLQCYAVGRTQGTVVDMGYSGTTVTPVYEGYVEAHGIQRAPIGLGQIDQRVLEQLDALYTKKQPKGSGTKSGNGNGNPASNGFLPLYQVKQQRDFGWKAAQLRRRTPPFHEAARLFVAQECRLTGAGAAVDTTAANSAATGSTAAPTSFQAPHKTFSLPDGTEVQVSSQFRFQSAHILMGNPQIVVAPASANANEPPTPVPTSLPTTPEQEARQALFHKNKQDWLARLKAHEEWVANQGTDDGASKNLLDKEDEFSDAAAVGLAKRRTKRHKKQSMPQSSRTRFSQRFYNAYQTKFAAPFAEQSLTSAPIAQMICEAAYRCEREQQPTLLQNVVLGGGGSCLGPTEQALPDLLREQTERILHTHTPGWRVKLAAPGTAERSVLSWLGGSILASLGSFHELYVTKADYEEWGTAIVNRKCP